MAGLAEALDPQPEPNTLAYWMKPFKGYLDRQRKLAQEGSDYASQGSQAVRQGDLSGLAGMLMGPLGYVSSPINALIPTEEEAYAAFDGNTAPFVAGGLGLASAFLPGPKGMGKLPTKGVRAQVGGETGVNGYQYKGGQFLPSTGNAPGLFTIGGKRVKAKSMEIEPGLREAQPSATAFALYPGVSQYA